MCRSCVHKSCVLDIIEAPGTCVKESILKRLQRHQFL